MPGLFLKEIIIRGDLKRCLIVSPGNLAEQWQGELLRKFGLRFKILSNELIETAAAGNIFTEENLCIARLNKLSRNETLQEKLKATDWDLIVCDEPHKMSASVWGNEAVRYNNTDEVRARLYKVVDRSLNQEELHRLLDEHALTEDMMDVHRVMAICEDMERIEVHKL